jgi:hypothetical protein
MGEVTVEDLEKAVGVLRDEQKEKAMVEDCWGYTEQGKHWERIIIEAGCSVTWCEGRPTAVENRRAENLETKVKSLEDTLSRMWTVDPPQCMLGRDKGCPDDDPPKCPGCRAYELQREVERLRHWMAGLSINFDTVAGMLEEWGATSTAEKVREFAKSLLQASLLPHERLLAGEACETCGARLSAAVGFYRLKIYECEAQLYCFDCPPPIQEGKAYTLEVTNRGMGMVWCPLVHRMRTTA